MHVYLLVCALCVPLPLLMHGRTGSMLSARLPPTSNPFYFVPVRAYPFFHVKRIRQHVLVCLSLLLVIRNVDVFNRDSKTHRKGNGNQHTHSYARTCSHTHKYTHTHKHTHTCALSCTLCRPSLTPPGKSTGKSRTACLMCQMRYDGF